jgi:hypothetical protein
MEVIPMAKLSRMTTLIHRRFLPVPQRKEVSNYAKLCAIIDSAASEYKDNRAKAHGWRSCRGLNEFLRFWKMAVNVHYSVLHPPVKAVLRGSRHAETEIAICHFQAKTGGSISSVLLSSRRRRSDCLLSVGGPVRRKH